MQFDMLSSLRYFLVVLLHVPNRFTAETRNLLMLFANLSFSEIFNLKVIIVIIIHDPRASVAVISSICSH